MSNPIPFVIAGSLFFLLLIATWLWVGPNYGVYQQRLSGEAELAKAEYSRRTAVVEAQARLDAASKLAEAEVMRAQGVAKANQIIGESLKVMRLIYAISGSINWIQPRARLFTYQPRQGCPF